MENKKAVVMMSGGRDSMLAACYMVEDGYEIHMIGFDNGHMWESDYIQETAGRVVSTYGKDKEEMGSIH